MDKSYANGNGPNGTGTVSIGCQPPEAAAGSTTHWDLTLGALHVDRI